MERKIVVCQSSGFEDKVPILSVGEVVAGQVCAREENLVIKAVELHMLEPPAFVEPLGGPALADAVERRGVVEPELDSLGPKLCDQRGEQRRGARAVGRFAGAADGVGEHVHLEARAAAQGLSERVDEGCFGRADVERREEDAVGRVCDFVEEGVVKVGRGREDFDGVGGQVEAGDMGGIELVEGFVDAWVESVGGGGE